MGLALLRLVAFTVLLSAALLPAQPQTQPKKQPPTQAQSQPKLMLVQESQLDGNEALFTVLAAINAAGYDANLDSNANSPVRKRVREALASKHLDFGGRAQEIHRGPSPGGSRGGVEPIRVLRTFD